MKTAISIPDDVFASADEVARELGISRSELYANAVAEYLAKHRVAELTARLNEVYAEQPSGLHPKLRRAQAHTIGRLIGSAARGDMVGRPRRRRSPSRSSRRPAWP